MFDVEQKEKGDVGVVQEVSSLFVEAAGQEELGDEIVVTDALSSLSVETAGQEDVGDESVVQDALFSLSVEAGEDSNFSTMNNCDKAPAPLLLCFLLPEVETCKFPKIG